MRAYEWKSKISIPIREDCYGNSNKMTDAPHCKWFYYEERGGAPAAPA